MGGTLTGLEFGSRKTKTLLARLYDKTAEAAAKDTGWWHEVWGERYVPGLPVHRLEFEFSRQGLVEFDLNTPDQVLGAVGDLWSYATGEDSDVDGGLLPGVDRGASSGGLLDRRAS